MRLFLAVWCLLFATGVGAATRIDDMQVTVEHTDAGLLVQVSLFIEVPPAIAWQVMTDYDRMPAYIPDLKESRIVSAPGEKTRVLQKGVAHIGWFSHEYEVEREVELTPEILIKSHGIRGNMRKLEMETHLAAEGTGTRVSYRGLSIPDFWVPPIIGPALVKRQVVEQFTAIATEMRLRAGVKPPAVNPN